MSDHDAGTPTRRIRGASAPPDGPPAGSRASHQLRDAVARIVRARRPYPEPLETMTAPAFRAVVAERLRALERDLAEVRTRVNGLLFVVAGAVVTQVVLRLFG